MTTKRVYSLDGGYRTIEVESKQEPIIQKQEYPEFPYECTCGETFYTKEQLDKHYHYPERKEYYTE
jgi:hypothetical protein